jgi:hypothetical protein
MTVRRSRELLAVIRRTCDISRQHRLDSRAHLCYLRLTGNVDGRRVRAVVRRDGTLAADTALLDRAALLAAGGETFEDLRGGVIAASLSDGPLACALTLIRACDELTAVRWGG